MSALHPDPAIRPFSKSGYEILDDGFDRGEVMIWSVAPTQPQRGDLLLIERGGRPYDLTIAEVRAGTKVRTQSVGRDAQKAPVLAGVDERPHEAARAD